MNVAAHIIYVVFIGLALLDMFLVAPALLRSPSSNVTGRLLSTVVVLGGLVLSGYGRLLQEPFSLPPLSFIGLCIVDVGFVGYALWLPENGLLALLRRRRRGPR